jgi:hypothetical protein
MLQTEALNAMSDRAPLDAFTDEVTGGPVTRDQLTSAEIQYAGLENYTLEGRLPNLALIDRMIARSDRTFRAAIATLLNLRKHLPQPAPPRESSESLERRIAEFRARDEAEKAASKKNEETNLAPTQPLSNQPAPASAQPENRPDPLPGSRQFIEQEVPPRA